MKQITRFKSIDILLLAALATAGCTSNSVKAASIDLVLSPTVPILITDTPSLKNTATVFPPTPSPSVIETLVATEVPSPTGMPFGMESGKTQMADNKTAIPTDEFGLPVSHYITNISGHKQYFKLGCEAAATRDWALYFGFDINEFEFQNRLPLSDNPEVGFVGSVNSKWGQAPPYAYGVHAAPVAQLLQEYGMPATAVKNYTLTFLKQQIANDRPVIVWVIGNVVGGVPFEYTAKDGQKVIVAAYEHVVIVTGYNETHIRYLNNDKFFEAPTDVFLNSWKVLGNMALIAGK